MSKRLPHAQSSRHCIATHLYTLAPAMRSYMFNSSKWFSTTSTVSFVKLKVVIKYKHTTTTISLWGFAHRDIITCKPGKLMKLRAIIIMLKKACFRTLSHQSLTHTVHFKTFINRHTIRRLERCGVLFRKRHYEYLLGWAQNKQPLLVLILLVFFMLDCPKSIDYSHCLISI